MKIKDFFCIALSIFYLATVATAQTDFPINSIEFFGYTQLGNKRYLSAFITVPDQDTTISAYGGKLRRYDVHIAKMFEVTDYQCRTWRNSPIPYNNEQGLVWKYSANGGQINMGIFTIDCDYARTIAKQYGLGNPEQTTIFYFEARHRKSVPILDITGNKVDQWLTFVSNLKPQQSP